MTKDVPSGETIQAMLVTRVKREGADKEIGKERLDARSKKLESGETEKTPPP